MPLRLDSDEFSIRNSQELALIEFFGVKNLEAMQMTWLNADDSESLKYY